MATKRMMMGLILFQMGRHIAGKSVLYITLSGFCVNIKYVVKTPYGNNIISSYTSVSL